MQGLPPSTPITIDSRNGLPTMHFTDERTSLRDAALRHRNRSSSSSSNSGSPPSSKLDLATPVTKCTSRGPLDYGRMNKSFATPDSGYEGQFTPASPTSHYDSSRKHLRNKRSEFVNEEVKTPLRLLIKRWKRYNTSLYTSSEKISGFMNMRPSEMLPLLVVIVVVCSGIFTILTLNNAIRHAQGRRNAKYQSIEFAHQKRLQSEPFAIKDENGLPLGGKRASIQFAYDRTYEPSTTETVLANGKLEHQPSEPKVVVETDGNPGEAVKGAKEEEIPDLDMLTLKVANDVLNLYQQIKQEEAARREKKERLLEKVRNFGHFGTTKVNPEPAAEGVEGKDEPEAVDNLEEKAAVGRKKRSSTNNSQKKTPRNDPLLAFKNQQSNQNDEPDDPFRFISQ